MESTFAARLAAGVAGIALLAPASALAESKGGWNQGRVTAIAEALAEEMAGLHIEAGKVPPQQLRVQRHDDRAHRHEDGAHGR
ncbi:MAG: hypothetical protein ABFS46_23370 [Myxococcota bacterium]